MKIKGQTKPKANWVNWFYWPLGLLFFLVIGFGLGAFIRFTDDIATMTVPPSHIESDAIVVLTGGAQRIGVAVDLLQKNEGKRLFISGVNPNVNEAALRRVSGASDDLFKCCIEFGNKAEDTNGNGKEIAAWADTNNFNRLTVVTNDYHMRRSLYELGQVGTTIRFEPYPIKRLNMEEYAWLKNPEALRLLIREFVKLNLAYLR